MIAATGGLEVANERLLAKMNKGVTLTQAVQSAQAFGEAGVMVHAYLMYGFPTQSQTETLQAMEYVRQMFSLGLLRSAFWHRFVLTQHSGVAAHPHRYEIEIPKRADSTFAQNDIPHHDPKGGNHAMFDSPLEQSLRHWMRGQHIDKSLQHWFEQPIPKCTISKRFIQKKMRSDTTKVLPKHQILWIGAQPLSSDDGLYIPDFGTLSLSEKEQEWVLSVLDAALPKEDTLHVKEIIMIPEGMDILEALRPAGLLFI